VIIMILRFVYWHVLSPLVYSSAGNIWVYQCGGDETSPCYYPQFIPVLPVRPVLPATRLRLWLQSTCSWLLLQITESQHRSNNPQFDFPCMHHAVQLRNTAEAPLVAPFSQLDLAMSLLGN